jgi:SAM-dependent methyltransferase
VGIKGSVVGVDISQEQLALARDLFEATSLFNVALVEASAYDTRLPRAAFDLVYCRFLLDHLTDAAAALTEMQALVKPGGVVACEELDFTAMGSDPPEVAYRREVVLMRSLAAKTGMSGKGLLLHRLFRDVGLSVEEVTLFQPAFVRGASKRLWEYAVAEFAPALIDAGYYTREELDARIEGLRRANSDDRTLALLPRKVQVWGRRSL